MSKPIVLAQRNPRLPLYTDATSAAKAATEADTRARWAAGEVLDAYGIREPALARDPLEEQLADGEAVSWLARLFGWNAP